MYRCAPPLPSPWQYVHHHINIAAYKLLIVVCMAVVLCTHMPPITTIAMVTINDNNKWPQAINHYFQHSSLIIVRMAVILCTHMPPITPIAMVTTNHYFQHSSLIIVRMAVILCTHMPPITTIAMVTTTNSLRQLITISNIVA